MISLSLDTDPATTRAFAAKNKMDWPQGFTGQMVGERRGGSVSVSKVMPFIMLLDSNGRVFDARFGGGTHQIRCGRGSGSGVASLAVCMQYEFNAKTQRRKGARAGSEIGFLHNAHRLVSPLDGGKFLFASSGFCAFALKSFNRVLLWLWLASLCAR
jgi:hypothetical protein